MSSRTPAQVVLGKKAILFDLFHTLTSAETGRDQRPATFELLGVSRQALSEQTRKSLRARMTGELNDPLQIMRTLAHAIDPATSEEKIAAATERRVERFALELLQPPPEALPVIQALKRMGKKIALVSNADAGEVAAWPRSPLAALFDEVTFSCHVGCTKPEPEIYRLCMKRLGVTPAQCVFIGDGGFDELAGAKALGITTIMMAGVIRELWPDQIEPRRAQADYMVERLTELVDQDADDA